MHARKKQDDIVQGDREESFGGVLRGVLLNPLKLVDPAFNEVALLFHIDF